MIISIIGIISLLFIVVSIYLVVFKIEYLQRTGGFLFFIVPVFLLLFLPFICKMIEINNTPKISNKGTTYSVTKTIPLKSAQLDSAVSGNFILGSGTIDSCLYYYVYVHKNGFYKLAKYPAWKTVIKESTADPQIKFVTVKWKNPTIWQTGIERQIYILAVPSGTVIKEFNLMK